MSTALAVWAQSHRQALKLGLGRQRNACVGDLEQVEPVEPHSSLGAPFLEACRADVRRPQRPLESPLAGNKKPGNRTILWHGTEKFGPRPVPEQVIGAIADGCSGRSQGLNGWHVDPEAGAFKRLFVRRVWCMSYTRREVPSSPLRSIQGRSIRGTPMLFERQNMRGAPSFVS